MTHHLCNSHASIGSRGIKDHYQIPTRKIARIKAPCPHTSACQTRSSIKTLLIATPVKKLTRTSWDSCKEVRTRPQPTPHRTNVCPQPTVVATTTEIDVVLSPKKRITMRWIRCYNSLQGNHRDGTMDSWRIKGVAMRKRSRLLRIIAFWHGEKRCKTGWNSLKSEHWGES